MLKNRLSRLWNLIRRRSPAQHLEALRKRLMQAEELERAAEAELCRLRSKRGETRAIKRATRRFKKLGRRTDRLRRLVAEAQRLVK